jgi:hypothetical protein
MRTYGKYLNNTVAKQNYNPPAPTRYSMAGSMRTYSNYLKNTVAKQNRKKSRNLDG